MTHYRSRARSSPVTRTKTRARRDLLALRSEDRWWLLRVSVDVARHGVEGFYYGEGDRGRSSKVIHHFLPCRSLIRSYVRWSRRSLFEYPANTAVKLPADFLGSLVHSRGRFFEGWRRSYFEVASMTPRFRDPAKTRWSWNGLLRMLEKPFLRVD